MKHRDSFFEKMLISFMRSAEGARYRKGFLFAFLASCCPIALLFAWLFHFLGAVGTFSIAAALMALALAHLDACESEASAQEHPAFTSAARCRRRQKRPYLHKKASV